MQVTSKHHTQRTLASAVRTIRQEGYASVHGGMGRQLCMHGVMGNVNRAGEGGGRGGGEGNERRNWNHAFNRMLVGLDSRRSDD